MAAFLAANAGIDAGSIWDWLLQSLIPNAGVHTIAVTADDRPLLFTRNADYGAVGVLDAMTGEHIRNLDHAGLAGPTLVVP